MHLGPGYQYDQGDHKVSLSISLELPVLNQNQGPIEEAVARRSEAAARFAALQARVLGEIDRAAAAFGVAQANVSTLESLAAAHRRQSEMVEAQVRVGEADQVDLLNSRIELVASELVQLTARVKLHQAFAALENAVQRPLDMPPPGAVEQAPRGPTDQAMTP
jgi:outer membrane protein TolC